MREYLLVLTVAMAVTYLASGFCRRLAMRTRAIAQVRDRDVHVVPIPYFGGIAMLAGVTAAVSVALQLPFLGRQELVRHDVGAVLLAAAVICAVGVIDDVFELGALPKMAGQVLAAALVAQGGVRMLWIPLPDRIIALDTAASIAITVFFIVVCTNAVNFVDGLDGLAAGVVGIGALAFFTYCYVLTIEQDLVRATTSGLITVAIAGACMGFLPHNFFPARMFMGDSGSMLLGFLLATSTISLTGQIDPSSISAGGGDLIPAYLPLVLPLAVLALPLLDLGLAWIRRANAGRWWFAPDKQHLHHRLLDRGHSHRRAVLIMYIWSALISFGAITFGLSGSWAVVIAMVLLAIGVGVLTAWRTPTHRQGPAEFRAGRR